MCYCFSFYPLHSGSLTRCKAASKTIFRTTEQNKRRHSDTAGCSKPVKAPGGTSRGPDQQSLLMLWSARRTALQIWMPGHVTYMLFEFSQQQKKQQQNTDTVTVAMTKAWQDLSSADVETKGECKPMTQCERKLKKDNRTKLIVFLFVFFKGGSLKASHCVFVKHLGLILVYLAQISWASTIRHRLLNLF